jgi:hypothetical protein
MFTLNICRQEIIARLQNQHTLVSLVTDNLSKYMDDVRKVAQGKLIKICIISFLFYCNQIYFRKP